jgi:hypothetical protein
MNVSTLSFNNGEVTPMIFARSDIEKYSSSCRIMENMLPTVWGPATRRPGTRFIKAAKYSPTIMIGE